MSKGTAARGRHSKGKTHIRCRRCSKRSYHIRKKVCSSCGYGKSTKLRYYKWKKKS